MLRVWLLILIALINIILGAILYQEVGYKSNANSISNQEKAYILAFLKKKSIPDCYVVRTEYGFKCVGRDKKVYKIYTNK